MNKDKTDWWIEYIKGNPFTTVGNVSLLMGGILFLIYFFHINYMPTLDISNSIHLLFAMSLMGFFLMSILVLVVILPSLLRIELPEKKAEVKKQKEENKFFRYFQLVWIIIISAFSFIIISPIMMNTNSSDNLIRDIIFIIVIIIFNVFFIDKNDYIKGFLGGFLLLIGFMFFSKNYNLISSLFVKDLHLGGYVMYQAHVKKQSCDILKSYNKSMIQSENSKDCIVSNLNVLLSLGKEILFQIETQKDGNVSVLIPSEDIVSYSWKNKTKKEKE